MTGDQYPTPGPGNQPHLDNPVLNNYRVVLINGLSPGNVASPNDLATFCKIAKADGYIASDKLFIRYEAIATIEAIGPWSPQQNVVTGQFGPAPVS